MLQTFLDTVLANSWVVEVFVITLGTGIVRFIVKLVFDRLARQLEKTHTVYDDALLTSARKPLGLAIWILGVCWAAEVAGQYSESELFSYIEPIRQVAVIWLLAWFAVRFVHSVERQLVVEATEPRVDRTTALAIGKLLRASIIITALLMALQGLGFSVSGVLAFGGLGGIAIGFASRDLLANFFGAMMIFLDRPFSVGDWIRSPDQEIEGTVEEIGWRLTRIRTFDQRPLYVPNAIFTSLSVENPSRMLNRRIKETIGVRYTDLDVLPAIVEDVTQMLKNHEEIDQNRTLMVNFVSFGASSLDFFIYTFTKTTVWADFHKIKQDVLLQIAEIIRGHGAEIAFPTRTIEMVDTILESVPESGGGQA
jgi:MscS family membrane protein